MSFQLRNDSVLLCVETCEHVCNMFSVICNYHVVVVAGWCSGFVYC